MSATATTADATVPAKGKKKLIVIIAAALLVLVLGGGAAVVLLKKKPADEESAEGAQAGEHAPARAAARLDPKHPPVFVPLEPFTVNLADRESERYAQIGITLEIEDAQTGEQIKLYMPAVRNNILMAIADRNASELLGRDGKTRLAERIKRETARALGFEVADDEPAADAAEDEDGKARPKPKGKARKKKAEPELPIRGVHFSNFIVQ